MEIGDMIKEEMKGEFSDRQIRRLLPSTAKGKQGGASQTKMDKMSVSEHDGKKEKCIACGKLISPYVRSNGGQLTAPIFFTFLHIILNLIKL